MFCKAYNQSLTNAAAGGELSPALRAHLAQCDSCRSSFAQEQYLYAAIDKGLYAAANPEIPSTLFPRVRVALNNETVQTTTGLFPSRLLIAGGIVITFLGVFVLSRFLHHDIKQDAGTSPLVATASSPDVPSSSRSKQVPPKIRFASRLPDRITARRGPEVLLPVGQTQASDRMIAALRTVKFSESSESDKKDLALESLTVKPIEIEPLKPASSLGDK